MSWAKLCDGFWRNSKVLACEPATIGFFACCISYCADELNDGRIPKRQLHRVMATDAGRRINTARALRQLQAAGMVAEDGDHVQVQGWSKYNPSSAQVKEKKAATLVRVQRHFAKNGRKSSKGTKRADPASAVNGVNLPVNNGVPVPVPLKEQVKEILPDGAQQARVGAPSADVAKAPPPAKTDLAVAQTEQPPVVEQPPLTRHETRRGARGEAHRHNPIHSPSPSPNGALMRDSSWAPSALPIAHLPAAHVDDLAPLGLPEAMAAICACDPRSFGAPYSQSPRHEDQLRKMAGLVTHRDIDVAFLRCRAKGAGKSVIGRSTYGMGLMIAILDETVAARIHAIDQSRAREFNSELRRQERHAQEQTRFAAEGGYVDWFQEAIDGKLGN